jgi:hypothetical protein
MSNSTSNDTTFSHVDTMIEALPTATDEERSAYLRAIVRAFEVAVGQAHARLGALVDALTTPEKR